ncbi:hypothetical protein ACLESD_20600 [Pyxidicoccus sp. 3LFB2]
MTTMRRLFNRLGPAAILGALLAASPVLADRAQCEAGCATQGGEALQTCMDRCPSPSSALKGGNAVEFSSCSTRCTKKFEKNFQTCSSRCPKDGPSGKEKAASVPEEE